MIYYSHAKEENGLKTGSRLLKQHLSGVFDKALSSLYPKLNISIENQNLTEFIKDLTCFHDLGKYTTFFQRYLLGEEVNRKLKSHSLLGAICLINKHKEYPFYAALLYLLVIHHHNNFQSIADSRLFMNDLDENNSLLTQIKDIENNVHDIGIELPEQDIGSLLKIPDPDVQKNIRKTIRYLIIKNASIQYYFTINYLFSLLIEADKLDASETLHYSRKTLPEKAVEIFIGRPGTVDTQTIDDISGYEQNKLRNWVRLAVIKNIINEEITANNIFTLTAPTGIGKTLTVLDFALRLKKIIRQNENFEPQIIYGLPFINIIEQCLSVYNEVFKNTTVNVLGHYQYADVFGEDKQNEGYNQKLMQLNTWQSDIVVTSFVQFFETLISNKNKMLLKFNHLAGSIVILDEVQTIRLEQIPLLGAVLFYLTKYLHTRVILMTATKPKIFELANKEILEPEGERARPYELLKDYEKVFKKFNRTKIVPLLDKPVFTSEEFYKIFVSKREGNRSCLIVCNTVQRSVDIYNELNKWGIAPLYYLSTNIVPAVRLKIIQSLKKDLRTGKAPVLVSTQVVEAGVDLDFDVGFRDLGPVDSIVQVAGRINRENTKKRELSPLYIVDFHKEKSGSESAIIYDSLSREQVLKALRGKTEIPEKDYLGLIEDYFSNISEIEAFHKARYFYRSLKTLKYDGDDFAVNKFRIIEESPWAVPVFVELNDEAVNARNAFNLLLTGKISKENFDRNYKKIFHQYIIAVPGHLPGVREIKLNGWNLTENLWYIPYEKIADYYTKNTGFIRVSLKEEIVCIL
ncbi:MAG: CRISPR-associated helicase Cas3' [Bacteroidales bacterium]|nr:CRISPR-associated helicase Cas3' [Bacteroidales bacterium]